MFFEKTEGEKLIELIKRESPETGSMIMEYIDRFESSDQKRKMEEGVRYYFNDSDIQKRKIEIYQNGTKVEDKDATNNKIPTAWHKTLTDQKRAYLASKPPSIDSKVDDDPAIDRIEEMLGDEFEDVLPELVKHATNKGIEWLHVYVNERGEFDYMIVPAQEFIPLYDNTKRKELVGGIRFYDLDDDTRKVELWDDQTVTFYEKIEDDLVLDMSYDVNPQPHFYYNDNGYGWGKEGYSAVPFIGFRNNEECVGDLVFYKDLIDAYEKVVSDTSNTLEDVQSFIFVLKDYAGTDLEEFMNDLKRYKVIKTDGTDGAGVETVRAEVPTEATEMYLDRLTEMIYQAGQGVNVSTDKFGQSPSGVAIKFLYTFLDMKANTMERKFAKALQELMWFVCEYLSIAENIQSDYRNYTFTFNKAMIMNEQERSQIARESLGVISRETIITNHPWVTDPQLEKERLEQEEDEYARGLPSVEDTYTDDQPLTSPGEKKEEGVKTCPKCGGDGKISSPATGNQIQCPKCKGDGTVTR